jgi:hypothetical protein
MGEALMAWWMWLVLAAAYVAGILIDSGGLYWLALSAVLVIAIAAEVAAGFRTGRAVRHTYRRHREGKQ